MLPTVRLGKVVPSDGFRWVYENDDGVIELRDPPADWSAGDYECTSFNFNEDGSDPVLPQCLRFYLATSLPEYREAAPPEGFHVGHLVEPGDLYLRFASERPNPASIKAMADQFGLLDIRAAWGRLREYKGAHDLNSAFGWEWLLTSTSLKIPSGEDTPRLLGAEPAYFWLSFHSRLCSDIKRWIELKNKQDPHEISEFLQYRNENAGLGLSIYSAHNEITNKTETELIARSLITFIDAQLSLSMAASVTHRQCIECTKWMAIHPGAGRPDKQYCSDACRMRAYRKRKSAT